MAERGKMDAPFCAAQFIRKREQGFGGAAREAVDGPIIVNSRNAVTTIAKNFAEVTSVSFAHRASRRACVLSDRQRIYLFGCELPNIAENQFFVDLLHRSICIMDPDDRRIGFIAGCLSYDCQRDGLTSSQASACQAILKTLCKAWAESTLVCQNTAPTEDVKELPPLVGKH